MDQSEKRRKINFLGKGNCAREGKEKEGGRRRMV